MYIVAFVGLTDGGIRISEFFGIRCIIAVFVRLTDGGGSKFLNF